MALPSSRSELIEWVRMELGEPVIKVNVSEEQIESAIDSALQYWQEYNESGQERIYVAKQVSAEDIAAGYLKLPDSVQSVYKVIDPKQPGSTGSKQESLFDVTYQFMSFNVRGFTGAGVGGGAGALSDFFILRQYMAELDKMFSIAPSFRFRHTTQKCYIDFMGQYFQDGDYALLEVQAYADPEKYERVWQNRYLRLLAAAYTKKQWGQNLSKFTNVNLPSGLTLNGAAIYEAAMEDIRTLEQEIMDNGEPLGFIVA